MSHAAGKDHNADSCWNEQKRQKPKQGKGVALNGG